MSLPRIWLQQAFSKYCLIEDRRFPLVLRPATARQHSAAGTRSLELARVPLGDGRTREPIDLERNRPQCFRQVQIAGIAGVLLSVNGRRTMREDYSENGDAWD